MVEDPTHLILFVKDVPRIYINGEVINIKVLDNQSNNYGEKI